MGRFEHVDRQAGFVATGGFFQLHGSGGCEVDMFLPAAGKVGLPFPLFRFTGVAFRRRLPEAKVIVFRMIVSDMNPFGT